MSFSVNEVETLAAKAARGAGAPPAQAARFGRAAVHHLAAARDPEALLDALAALPRGPILDNALAPAPTPLGDSYREAQGRPPPVRLSLSDALRDRLLALAQATYVPASTASRQAGAGAGLTDND